MTKWVLTLAAIYMAIIGLALMLAPLKFGVGAVPADASSQLLALMRLLGGPFLGIAVLNWLTRSAEHSPTLRAILAANLIGFGAVAANDVHGVLTGEAREIAKLFLLVHLAFTAAFALALFRRAQR